MWLGLVCAAPAVLAGCAGLMLPRTLSLDADELQRLIERRFPIERRLLEVLEVNLSAPRLRLLPDVNRLAAIVDIGTRDRLFGGSWRGRLDFEAALRFEAADPSLRLTQVRVRDFSLDTAASGLRAQAERLGAALVERVLEDLVVYRLPPERSDALRRAGLVPGAVTVTARGVDVTLVPVAR